MRFRSSLLAPALVCVLLVKAAPVHAVGLGEAQVRSHLGQPLDVRMPITDVRDSDGGVALLRARLLPPFDYQKHGVPVITYPLHELRVDIVESAPMEAYLALSSRSVMREPLITVLVELRAGAQAVIRRIDVLLDPAPGSTGSSGLVEEQVAGDHARYGPVRSGETLSDVAEQYFRVPGLSLAERVEILRELNTAAFLDPADPRSLRAGAYLQIPPASGSEREERRRVSPDVRPIPKATGSRPLAGVKPSKPRAPVKPPAIKASGETLNASASDVFLAPGMFALRTRFESWLNRREREIAGLRHAQQGEPERFRVDWMFSSYAHRDPALTAAGIAAVTSPAPAAAPAATPEPLSATPTPQPSPTSEPIQASLEADLADNSMDSAGHDEPMLEADASSQLAQAPTPPAASPAVTPPPALISDSVADDEVSASAESSTRSWWPAWLVVVIVPLLLVWWRRRLSSEAEPDAASLEPELAGMPAVEASLQVEASVPEIIQPDLPAESAEAPGMDLRRRLKALHQRRLGEDQARELLVAETMLQRGKLEPARRIIEQIEAGLD